ncbi:MAG: transporter [Verrucomicrobia bacterium]|nr:transporter [Verrucomicrobiota bacterium]
MLRVSRWRVPGWRWLAAGALATGASAADKSGYSLANPTPVAEMREMSTDRPDATESPFTVDAGHAQLEMDFASWTQDKAAGVRTTTVGAGAFNVRLGLRNDVEAGIFVAPYVRSAEQPGGTVAGVGDMTLRTKVNLWGNYGGKTAGGLIFDATLPTARRGLGSAWASGAVIFPLAVTLTEGWDLGAMTAVDYHHRDSGAGSTATWINTATLGRELTKSVSCYVELTSGAGEGPHAATFDAGVAWQCAADTQLDLGVNLGLSRAADDVVVFTGLSRRF